MCAGSVRRERTADANYFTGIDPTTTIDNHLLFNVQNKEMFEIPLKEVTNTSLTAKHEVMLELGGPDGEIGAPANKKGDQLVEMRFYIPGTKAQEGDAEEESAANVSESRAMWTREIYIYIVFVFDSILTAAHLETTTNNQQQKQQKQQPAVLQRHQGSR